MSVTTEAVHEEGPAPGREASGEPRDAVPARWALEATYEGSIRFDEANLEDPATIRPAVDALTRWIASTLVQLADLPLRFMPPDAQDDA